MRPWNDEELAALARCYPACGPYWTGWRTRLPGRMPWQIQAMANDHGIEFVGGVTDDEVRAMLDAGMAPSDIARRMGWQRGMAVERIVSMWCHQRGDA